MASVALGLGGISLGQAADGEFARAVATLRAVGGEGQGNEAAGQALHRLAKGSLPDDLNELFSTYIDAIPVDISTGNPIAWERKGKHRYRIPSTDNRSFTWKYDPILAAIQLGDLDRLEKMSDEGWELTTPKPGEETKHAQALYVGRDRDPDPNYLGVPESVSYCCGLRTCSEARFALL